MEHKCFVFPSGWLGGYCGCLTSGCCCSIFELLLLLLRSAEFFETTELGFPINQWRERGDFNDSGKAFKLLPRTMETCNATGATSFLLVPQGFSSDTSSHRWQWKSYPLAIELICLMKLSVCLKLLFSSSRMNASRLFVCCLPVGLLNGDFSSILLYFFADLSAYLFLSHELILNLLRRFRFQFWGLPGNFDLFCWLLFAVLMK